MFKEFIMQARRPIDDSGYLAAAHDEMPQDTTVFGIRPGKGYWHVELDEKSSLLTTFNTPFG